MRLCLVLTAVLVVLASCYATATDYGELMARKVKAALGVKATRGYTFATYPVDNFGIATAYESKVGPAQFICATWECVGISDDLRVDKLDETSKMRVVANGQQYATVGAGESLNLTEDEKKALGLKAILPKVLQVLGISFDLSSAKHLTTEFTAGPITIRTLRRQQMISHIKGSQGQEMEKAAFNAGNLVLAYADIVASSMTINIKVDASTDADLEAKLSGALKGKVGAVIGTDASLGLKVNKATKGEYTFKSTRPLILAVYTKKQPAGSKLGAQGGWSTWRDTELGASNRVTAQTIDLGDVP